MLIRPRRIQHISCWFKFLPQLILMIVVDWKINISFSGAGIFLLLLLLLNMHLIDSYNNYASEKVINLANVVTDATYFPWSFRCGAIYIYIYIYIYMYGTRSSFATACEGWVLVTPRKAITKVQKASGQKPTRRRWEKGRNTQKLKWMKHELTRTSPTTVRVFR